MSWLHNSILLPLSEPERHKGLARRLRKLENFDALSREEQLAIQEARIHKLLDHAYQTSPYYRRIFNEAGFRATDWTSGNPIPLPVLTRDLLRQNVDSLRSRAFSPDQLREAATGGTTSSPAQIWRDIEGLRDKTALQIHLERLSGYDQGTSVMYVWGAMRDLAQNPSWRWKLYEQGLMRRTMAGAGQLNDEVMEGFAEKLNRYKPRILYGYAGSLAYFANYLEASGKPFHKPSRLIVTAEVLTSADRETMERTFGCPVTEHYGSRELGMIAAQCDQGGRLHFHPSACYIELVYSGQGPEGPIYQLIVTDLLNFGMPMIRYDTGDCVTIADQQCICGCPYPSVKSVLGRVSDSFVLPDGSVVPGPVITLLWGARAKHGVTQVKQIQLVQKTHHHVHLRYAAEGDAMAIRQELVNFQADVEKFFQVKMHWTTERVPEILRERSGKMRFCISEVGRPGNTAAV